MSAAYAPAVEGRCCICDTSLPINANLCVKHKEAGKVISQQEGIRFIDAADRLYWAACDEVAESYCIEHECWHSECPRVPHLDFSLVHQDAISPSRLATLGGRREPLSTGYLSVQKRLSTVPA